MQHAPSPRQRLERAFRAGWRVRVPRMELAFSVASVWLIAVWARAQGPELQSALSRQLEGALEPGRPHASATAASPPSFAPELLSEPLGSYLSLVLAICVVGIVAAIACAWAARRAGPIVRLTRDDRHLPDGAELARHAERGAGTGFSLLWFLVSLCALYSIGGAAAASAARAPGASLGALAEMWIEWWMESMMVCATLALGLACIEGIIGRARLRTRILDGDGRAERFGA